VGKRGKHYAAHFHVSASFEVVGPRCRRCSCCGAWAPPVHLGSPGLSSGPGWSSPRSHWQRWRSI